MNDWSDLIEFKKKGPKLISPHIHKYKGWSLLFFCGRKKGKATVRIKNVTCPTCAAKFARK
jgi:hypothetical protein